MTAAAQPRRIQSRDNPLLKDLRRAAQDPGAYRRQGRIWLEGDHLCRAACARGVQPALVVYAESIWQAGQALPEALAVATVVVDDAVFASISGLGSPAGMGFVLNAPPAAVLDAHAPSLVLDRVQDAGNVGAMLRCAAAFGFRQVVALQGTAALWSPKVLRAGMGAHFALSLIEGADASLVNQLAVPLLATSSHQGDWLHTARLPWPCAWLLGHEGRGVSPSLLAQAARTVRIAQPGGEESLNVATAAAICLHASCVQQLKTS